MTTSRSMIFLGLYALLLALLFYGLIRIFSHGPQRFFLLEGFGLLVLVVLSLVAFMSYTTQWGRPLFFIVFLLYLVNLVLVWAYQGTLYVSLVLLAILGFIISFPVPGNSPQKVAPPKKKEELHSMVFEEQEGQSPSAQKGKLPLLEPKKESSMKTKPSTAYSPGKYVASKNSNVYHEPKCEWAKKIEKSRQLWFEDKKEAVEKGFRKHECVQ